MNEPEIILNLTQLCSNLQKQLAAQAEEIAVLKAVMLSFGETLSADNEGRALVQKIVDRAGALQSDLTLPVQTEEVWDAYLMLARRYLTEGTEERAS